MNDDALMAALQMIIEQNRQIIAMLSGQWTAMGGYTNPHQSNSWGQAQFPQPQEQIKGRPNVKR